MNELQRSLRALKHAFKAGWRQGEIRTTREFNPSWWVPGGILDTDQMHDEYDCTCSRCRRDIGSEEVPIVVFVHDPDSSGDKGLVAYCDDCRWPGVNVAAKGWQ